jgi:uncharacterized membrane protein
MLKSGAAMAKKRKRSAPAKSWERPLVKSITYRCLIMVLDFTVLSLFTGSTKTALGFVVLSNIYTTVVYFFHERVWDKIRWGVATAK